MRDLIAKIAATPGCSVLPPVGVPRPHDGHVMPQDLLDFYELAGGCALFKTAAYPFAVVPASRFRLANPDIVGEVVEDDITSSWYIVGEGVNSSEYVTIDLHPDRLGRCYDSFWDRHGIPGSCPVIAVSFSDLIKRMLQNGGRHWYWLQPYFDSLGDAYE